MICAPHLIGDPLVRTQHLLGARTDEWISETEVTTIHQIRAAHQRYVDLDLTKVAHKGHGLGTVKHWFKKIDGVWKLSGIRPEMYWTEYDFPKIFRSPESPPS